MIIDTHCHLDLYPNPHSLIDELEQKNVITIGVTNLPSHFKIGYPHTRNLKKTRLALGLHPLMASKHIGELPLFMEYIDMTSYIGEVGLDFSREGIDTKHIQIKSFEKILKKIGDGNKILSIHSRGAEKEVLEMLRKYNVKNAIFHWYSGSLKTLDEIVESGFYFSLNTAMIKSKKGKEVINRLPRENILTETDGPFIKHNGRIVKYSDITLIIEHLNKYSKFNKMEEQIFENYMNLVDKIK